MSLKTHKEDKSGEKNLVWNCIAGSMQNTAIGANQACFR